MVLNKDCIEFSGQKKDCPVSEKGQTYRIINVSNAAITVYKVDACLINDSHQQKCDYLFLVHEKEKKICHAYFIELKGADITSAIHQIQNSIDILCRHLHGYKIFGRIVCRRFTPNINSRKVKLEEKIKQLQGDLKIVATREYKEII